MRKLTYKQGCKEIEYYIEKYSKSMRDKRIRGLIDVTLWAVAQGDGPEKANTIITKYELNRPANGSHDWFDDEYDFEKPHVSHLDPTFKTPDHWKTMPTKKRKI